MGSNRVKPIFIFSLPRSGSTLLQRVLSSHEEIATSAEPWLLLPLLTIFEDGSNYSEYYFKTAQHAIDDFIGGLPETETDYLNEVSQFALNLYDKHAKHHKPSANYFIDKTPRYALIADKVVDSFPDAKFIFLWRNPLSIIASSMETWGAGRWNLYLIKVDLYKGLQKLLELYVRNPDRYCSINYEFLISDNEKAMKKVQDFIGIKNSALKFESAIHRVEGRMGDPTGQYTYSGISDSSVEKWKVHLRNPLRKAWCRRYLKWIGEERLAIMGYDYKLLLSELNAIPFSLKHLFSDILRMIYGQLHCILAVDFYRLAIMKKITKSKIYPFR